MENQSRGRPREAAGTRAAGRRADGAGRRQTTPGTATGDDFFATFSAPGSPQRTPGPSKKQTWDRKADLGDDDNDGDDGDDDGDGGDGDDDADDGDQRRPSSAVAVSLL